MNSLTNKQRGFTIIEVVLVLAIAGLIFLMVFIALPALQRNQRDTDRRATVGKVAAAITTFQSNKRGRLPCTAAGFPLASPACTGAIATADAVAFGRYIDANPAVTGWTAPPSPTQNINGQYTLIGRNNVAALPALSPTIENNIYYVPRADCGTDGTTPTAATSTRKAIVVTALENGNYSSWYCQAV